MIRNIFVDLSYWESIGLWFTILNLKKNLDSRTYTLTMIELSKSNDVKEPETE